MGTWTVQVAVDVDNAEAASATATWTPGEGEAGEQFAFSGRVHLSAEGAEKFLAEAMKALDVRLDRLARAEQFAVTVQEAAKAAERKRAREYVEPVLTTETREVT